MLPFLMWNLTNNPKTAAQRPVSVYVNGRDLTPNIPVESLKYEQTGSHETGQATFQVHDVRGGGTTYPELTDGAPIRIYDARLDRDNWGGLVISRTTTIVGAGTLIDVTAVDLSVLLDRANISSESSGGLSGANGDSDATRIAYLLGKYGGRLNPDVSTFALKPTTYSDAQVLTSTSLRMAIEAISALAYGAEVVFTPGFPKYDYFIDAIGRLNYSGGQGGFQSPAAPGQAVINGLPPADGSGYVTTLKAAAANYWQCSETSGTTLADSVGSSTATVVGNAPYQSLISPTLSTLVGPIPKLSPNPALTGGAVSGNFEVAQTAAVVTNVTDNFAFEFWFVAAPLQAFGPDNYFFYNGAGGTNGWGAYFAGAGNGTYPYSISVGYGGVGSWSTGFTITDQAWHHFALEKRNGLSTPFLDGIAGTTSALVPIAPTGVTTLWGDGTSGGHDGHRFIGGLAHVAVYH